jgi:hypothetical protein
MRKEKQIQISQKTFCDLYRLIISLDYCDLEPGVRQLAKSLERDIEDKLEARLKRKAFTEYKTAEPDTEDREAKRKKYLELAGIHRNWTSPNETLFPQ